MFLNLAQQYMGWSVEFAEQALKQRHDCIQINEARLKALLKTASDGIHILDASGTLIEANDVFLQSIGCDDSCLGQLKVWDWDTYFSQDLILEGIADLFSSGDPMVFDTRHRHTDGHEFWVEVSVRGFQIDGQNLIYASSRDISEHRLVGEALRESATSLKEAESIAMLGSYVLDIRSGVWRSSDNLDQLLGIDKTYEHTTAGWEALVHPDDRSMMADYQQHEVIGQGKAFNKEYRIIRHHDQTERWMHGLGKLEVDDQGQVVLMRGTIQDITDRKLAEQALQESEEKYRRLFELSEDPMWLILDERFVMANQASAHLLGYETTEALADIHPSGLSPELQPDGQRSYDKANAMMAIACREGYHRFEWAHQKKNGEELPVEVSLTRIPYAGRHALFCIWRDITERKRSEATLVKLSLAVEQSPSSIIITDLDRRIEYVNQTFCNVTGYSAAEAIGQTPQTLLHSGKTPKATYDAMWAHLNRGEAWRGEFINRRKDGSEYIESVAISPVRRADGKITNYLAVKHDITEKKHAEARIENLAHFDQLTGLPNRTSLIDRFKYASSLAHRNGQHLAVMFLGLDNFKSINDTLGHGVGDQLLMQAAERLKTMLREEDTVTRFGGDEFILLFYDTDAPGADHVAAKLIEQAAHTYHTEQHQLVITHSIGIAIYPEDGEDLDTLVKHADTAMHRAKQAGRNGFRFFTPEMHEYSARTLLLSNDLHHALKNGELQLHYQPQIASQDHRILGVEALLRWRHPKLGAISPAEFIPVAESSGQIIAIGEWVLHTATSQLKAWMDSGLPSMTVAVNLSAIQFRQANIIEVVTRILDEVGLPHEYLELELTEAVAMDDPEKAIRVMNALHDHGIRMSIDDFGTGYSSLSYLKKFKVYKLKIDQSFVRHLATDPEDQALVSAIINMARSLGMHTIAEGVETAEQLAFLEVQGCQEIQGYYFSKPLTAKQLEAFVKTH